MRRQRYTWSGASQERNRSLEQINAMSLEAFLREHRTGKGITLEDEELKATTERYIEIRIGFSAKRASIHCNVSQPRSAMRRASDCENP